jgi:glycosyltransferase involved in cell wall biosynthesis
LDQNYPNLEYIVIDGGSSDGSVDIIKQHANQLSSWVSEKDAGHGDALNKGFYHTTGDIMAWLNSDDMYLPWTFRVVSEIFNAFPDVEWITGTPTFWNDQGAITHASPNHKNVFDLLLGDYAWIQQESTFWRRSLWERVGAKVDTTYQLMVDGNLWCRFFATSQLYSVGCILGGYRYHTANRAVAHMQTCHAEMRRAMLPRRCP